MQSTKRFADSANPLPPAIDSTTVVRKPVRRRRPLTSVYDSTVCIHHVLPINF